jgi:hypothetical protein
MIHSDAPFSTIESAHEFLALLGETIDEALNEVREELAACTGGQQQRRTDAWRVVLYTTTKLGSHVATSRRLLNDLRTLRNLMHRNSEGPAASRAAPVAQGAST